MISRWLQEKEKRKSFKKVFGGEEGQDVIAMLSNAHFVFRTSHANDPYTTSITLNINNYVRRSTSS